MNIESFSRPRYIIESLYPGSQYYVGNIIELTKDGWDNWVYMYAEQDGYEKKSQEFFYNYPNIFRLLEWWEHRTIEELLTIKYVKIVNYQRYYAIGDIVPIIGMQIQPLAFNLAGHQFHMANNVIPATEQEYTEFKKIN